MGLTLQTLQLVDSKGKIVIDNATRGVYDGFVVGN